MKPNESIKLWFEELERLGEFCKIIILQQDRKSGKIVKEYLFPHGEFDGIACFQTVFKDNNVQEFPQTRLKFHFKPPNYVYLWNFIKYLIRIPFYAARWTGKLSPSTSPIVDPKPVALSYLTLSLEETKIVQAKAIEKKVTLNSYLLFHLNTILLPYQKFSSLRNKSIWLIPVNIRSNLDPQEKGNHVGFIDLYLSKDQDMTSIDANAIRKFKAGEQYGGAAGVSVGVILGKFLLKALVKLNYYLQVRTGVFTNLGNWKFQGDEFDKLDCSFYGYAPLIRSQPVGAMTMSINQRRVLSLHFHKMFNVDHNFSNELLAKWKNQILS